MQYEEFEDFVKRRCFYETIYVDSEGRTILVLDMLSAFAMANKFEEVGRWPSAAIGKETLQDAIERERAVGYREGHRAVLAQRTWVGLTSEEIGEIYRVGWANNMELARAIEQKLKEKNSG